MISFKHTEGIAFIELNAPPVNALSLKMRQALSSAIHDLDADEQVKAIVLWPCRSFAAALILSSLAQAHYGTSRTFQSCVSRLKPTRNPLSPR